ncbi:hypothetical protein CLU79DRAFT_471105 [Phycomyces nitens]|nr:hypothetical protein CLU79DRAFT_471105 [Phycomyces nitens]
MKFYPAINASSAFPKDGMKDKDEVVDAMKTYAIENNFVLVTARSQIPILHLKCAKGGTYRGRRDGGENIKRSSETRRVGCPYLLRFSFRKKDQKYYLLRSLHEKEEYHNHPLSPKELSALHEGRMAKLTKEDITLTEKLFKENAKTMKIQDLLNDERAPGNKLTTHDINNWRYSLDLHGDTMKLAAPDTKNIERVIEVEICE